MRDNEIYHTFPGRKAKPCGRYDFVFGASWKTITSILNKTPTSACLKQL